MTTTGFETATTALLAALAESSVRALLLAAAVGGVLAIFRIRRTAWRLCAWTIVLWAALAMPALGRLLPAWRVPVAGLPALAWLQSATPTVEPDASGSDVRVEIPASMTSSVAPRDRAMTPATSSAAPNTSAPTPQHASSAARRALSLSQILIGIYLFGLLALGIRAAIGWMATWRLERAARPIEDADALARLARIASSIGLRHPPRLAESRQLFVPVTMSVTWPIVVLPDTWRDWDGAMLEAVLAHEVAHIARYDALTQRVSLVYRAICWFNPLAWWLPHQLMDLAEQASDESVLSAGTSQTQYARMLLEFFRAIPQPGHRADWHVAMARGAAASAEARVERILAWKGGHAMRLTKSVVLSVMLVVAPGVALTASVRPAPIAPEQIAPARTTAPQVQPAPAPPAVAARPVDVASRTPDTPRPSAPSEPPRSDASIAPVETVTMLADTQTPPVPAPPPPSDYWQRPLAPIQEGFGAGAYRPGPGVAWPIVVREVKPIYTDGAISARIEGDIQLEAVVLPDGIVGSVRVTKSLDARYGLDHEAIRAARQWVFKPAQVDGRPVSVVVPISLGFSLRSPATSPQPPGTTGPRPLADEFASGAYFTFGDGMVAPQAIGQTAQKYAPDVMRAKLDSAEALYALLTGRVSSISGATPGQVFAPQIITQIVPKYTPEAMRAKIQGQVDVEVIVMPDGTVGKARVVRSLDTLYGLDEQALIAARQSTFIPGALDGAPVPVLVTLTFTFRLH